MTAIQTDPALETILGPDIYIHPEAYRHPIHIQMESFLRIGSIIVECDLWKGWIWFGKTRKRKRDAGIGRIGFRRKIPYSRLKPDAIARCGVWISAFTDGGNVVHTLEYHDAVDPVVAWELTGDDRPFHLVEIVTPIPGADGSPESYDSLIRRATARVNELNQR